MNKVKHPIHDLIDQSTPARVGKIGETVPCDECGKEFTKIKNVHFFCSPGCRTTFRDRLRWEKHKEDLKESHKKWSQDNFQKRRDYMLKYTFGIDSDQYNSLLEKQGGCCFICQRHESEFKKKLAVDHDHVTGEIRGLLCQVCNKIIIGKNRDPELLQRASNYLRGPFTGWIVPKKKPKRKKASKKVKKT